MATYKDVLISLLVDGVDAVKQSFDEGRYSKALIRRAADSLLERDADPNEETLEFLEWADDATKPCVRGRAKPLPGERRTYKVQDISDGDPFIRLPVSNLGVKKGDAVEVYVSPIGYRIEVMPAAVEPGRKTASSSKPVFEVV